MSIIALTTVDNPYDPVNDFQRWFVFDVSHGYDTCGVLDSLMNLPEGATEVETAFAVENAVDRIVAADPFNFYKKFVSKDDATSASPG